MGKFKTALQIIQYAIRFKHCAESFSAAISWNERNVIQLEMNELAKQGVIVASFCILVTSLVFFFSGILSVAHRY